MALANADTNRYSSGWDLDPGGRALSVPPCYCSIAIEALESVSAANSGADIEARCKAVATATEAMTSLFLESDGIVQELSAQGADRLYETILGHLLRINLHNNPGMTRKAIATIERLRNSGKNWNGATSLPSKMAAHWARS